MALYGGERNIAYYLDHGRTGTAAYEERLRKAQAEADRMNAAMSKLPLFGRKERTPIEPEPVYYTDRDAAADLYGALREFEKSASTKAPTAKEYFDRVNDPGGRGSAYYARADQWDPGHLDSWLWQRVDTARFTAQKRAAEQEQAQLKQRNAAEAARAKTQYAENVNLGNINASTAQEADPTGDGEGTTSTVAGGSAVKQDSKRRGRGRLSGLSGSLGLNV